MTLATRIQECIELTDSLLCVGLDPATAKTAAEAEWHSLKLLDETVEYCCAVKPNIAFFERFGSAGLAALERVVAKIPADRVFILDAKRGDIGDTAQAYAAAAFRHLGADAVTVNPLMGQDAVLPFLDYTDKGALVLTRTSNMGASDFLKLRLQQGGDRLYERITETVLTWDPGGSVGFVVGATDLEAVRAVRHRAPVAPLLLPGVGAQGASLDEALLAGMDARGGGIIIPVSRGLSEAESPAGAAQALRERINNVRRVHRSARAS